MSTFWKEPREFFGTGLPHFWAVIAAAVLSYGFAICNFSLSIDEEIASISDQTLVWAQQGRWGIALFKFSFGTTTPLPFFQPALAVLLLLAAAAAWCIALISASNRMLEGSPWLILFAVLFVTIPSNYYYLSFNTYNIEVSFALLLTALCAHFSNVWVLRGHAIGAFVASAILAVLAISIYQSLLIVCFVGGVACYLIFLETKPDNVELRGSFILFNALLLLLPTLAGYLIYVAIDRLVALDKHYVDVFFKWGKLDTASIFCWLGSYLWSFVRGGGFEGGRIVLAFEACAAVSLLIYVSRGAKGGGVVSSLLYSGLIASPFALSLALGTPMPNRTQQVLPLVSGVLVLILILQLRMAQRGSLVCAIAIILAGAWNARTNTQLSLAEYQAFKWDEEIAHGVVGRLVESGWTGKTAPLIVIGVPPVRERRYLRDETIGASFFEWDNGGRAPFFMSAMGYAFHSPSEQEWRKASSVAEAMPDWPETGSVKFSDGIAIVKMGQVTDNQRHLHFGSTASK